MACASVNQLLVEKGLVSAAEIEEALRKAEARITSDDRFQEEDIRLANRDAMCFPIRVLQLANSTDPKLATAGFSELAKQVGMTKRPFNDQR
jgi:acid phosphatase class B